MQANATGLTELNTVEYAPATALEFGPTDTIAHVT